MSAVNHRVEADRLPWTPGAAPGQQHKALATDILGGCDIALVRLEPGASLRPK